MNYCKHISCIDVEFWDGRKLSWQEKSVQLFSVKNANYLLIDYERIKISLQLKHQILQQKRYAKINMAKWRETIDEYHIK